MKVDNFPKYIQSESKDCGPACLYMISKFYGKKLSINYLRSICLTSITGTLITDLCYGIEKLGFKTFKTVTDLEKLKRAPLPAILHWENNHYVVLYKINGDQYFVSDPAKGKIKIEENGLIKKWCFTQSEKKGIIILLEPAYDFFSKEVGTKENSFGLKILKNSLLKNKKLMLHLLIGMILSSLLQLCIPFLTQSVVDIGIQTNNIDFIYLVLLAQLFIVFGQTLIEINKGWIVLHLSAKVDFSMVSDFFIKLMRLPISYFDVKLTGDILQRINDHKRISKIITNTALNVTISLFNIIITTIILLYYNINVYLIFLSGTVIHLLWISIFLALRKKYDYKSFDLNSKEQSKTIEIISGIQDIKLFTVERLKRGEWEGIQEKLFGLKKEILKIEQYQGVGSNFITELTNIIVVFYSAKLVINSEITIGMMLAISTMLGSLKGPISQIVMFIRDFQDAKISIARIGEIHELENENANVKGKRFDITENSDIIIKNLSFSYGDSKILKDINLIIPKNKVTAFVGTSGSGKTTLMKLLLKYYDNYQGEINFNNIDIRNIEHDIWRNDIGVVMQEGFIFNNSIENNIALDQNIDIERMITATKIADIYDFINSLPGKFETKIGGEGVNVSVGQKQRILIARAVYRKCKMLFLDEATSALDSNTEKTIINNFNVFFNNKTVVLIAHRLSTVIDADQIVVLDKGEIVEIGNHKELVARKGMYHNLVKNQIN